jgi:hypothetical protein
LGIGDGMSESDWFNSALVDMTLVGAITFVCAKTLDGVNLDELPNLAEVPNLGVLEKSLLGSRIELPDTTFVTENSSD